MSLGKAARAQMTLSPININWYWPKMVEHALRSGR